MTKLCLRLFYIFFRVFNHFKPNKSLDLFQGLKKKLEHVIFLFLGNSPDNCELSIL